MPFQLIGAVDGRTLRFDLESGASSVGSGELCPVRLRDSTVSRHHADLNVTTDAIEISDGGSTNGTFVDGRRIRSATARGGSVVSFGRVLMRVVERHDSDLELGWASDDAPLSVATLTRLTESAADRDATVGIQPIDSAMLRLLPEMLTHVAGGATPLEVANRAGAELFRCLPLVSLRLDEGTDASVLWSAERADLDPGPALQLVGYSCRVHAILEPHAGRRSITPLFEILLAALDLATRRPVWGGPRVLRDPGARGPVLGDPAPGSPAAEGAERPSTTRPQPATVDPAVRTLYDDAERVAQGDISVLIEGESGTGKEVLARFLHDASARHERPFVALNCAALPQDLLEAELFGVEKGAATGVDARPGKFEQADLGTLFLDEIGDMAPATQAKLLRVLQERHIYRLGATEPRPARVRVLAATNRNVHQMIEDGDFRSDLFHRIAGWQVTLPALRQRRGDITNLAIFFLKRQASERQVRPAGISRSALRALESYDWPGNIRQLQQEIARSVLFLDHGEVLDTPRLSPEVRAAKRRSAGEHESPSASGSGTLAERLAGFEKREIERALAESDGSVTGAAATLGVHRATLYRRIKALKIEGLDTPPVEVGTR